METQEITVKNYRRSPKWGWGYSFTPTGMDAYSICTPTGPVHEGTLHQINEAKYNDRTWREHSKSAFYNTAWFYNGQRIIATWCYGLLKPAEDLPMPDDACEYEVACLSWDRANEEHHFKNDKYGYGWFSGFMPPIDELDVKIRIVTEEELNMARKAYVCTVQLLIEAKNNAQAIDVVHGILSEFDLAGILLDWAFLQIGGQFLTPTERIISDDYEEGDFSV